MLAYLGNLLKHEKRSHLIAWRKSFIERKYNGDKRNNAANTGSRAELFVEVLLAALSNNKGLDDKGIFFIRQMIMEGCFLEEIMTIVLEFKKFIQYLLLEEAWLGNEGERGIYLLDEWINQILLDVSKVATESYNELQKSKIKELSAISEINRTITNSLNINEVLQVVCQAVGEIVQEKITIMLLDVRFNELHIRASHGWKNPAKLASLRFRMGEGLSGLAAQQRNVIICEDVMRDERAVNRDLLLAEGIKAVVCLPMISNGKVIGVLDVYLSSPKTDMKAWVESLHFAVYNATVAIDNAILYKNNFESYFTTIKALVAAVDAKDVYTRGHSERVMEYAMLIANEMGLSQKEIEEIKIAGLLHDVGKIGIDTNILNKPGRLSDDEFSTVKSHPAMGVKILQQVEFLSSIVPAILHHHERFDGKGYPSGLRGDNIPLGARILSVADSLDAMISDRAYREGLPIEEAIAELKRNAGSQFDPGIVEAFLRIVGKVS